MISRYSYRLPRTVVKVRCFTQTTAILRLSSNKTHDVQCGVEGAPYYSVTIPKHVSCDLAGRDLGSQMMKLDLTFYGGCHFAMDKFSQFPSLKFTLEVASLLKKDETAELPAVLFHGGNHDGSVITLKGSDGEKMWDFTIHGADIFSKSLQDMK